MIEIRLEAPDAASLEAVLGMAPLVASPPPRVSELLDTPDWALSRARASLEVRRRAGRWEVAASWDEAGPVRRELLQALPSAPRVPLVLREGPVAERVRAIVARRPLHPVLSTSLVRRRLAFPLPPREGRTRAGVIHAVVDAIELAAPGGIPGARLHEVILRAAASRASEAEALAARLARELGLQPARLPRTLRALMLVHGDVPLLGRASGAVALGDSLGIAARKVLAANLRRVQRHDPGTRSGVDPEDLHDMRVGTRRMRAALRVFAPALAPARLDAFSAGLRRLGRQLGAVRDLDVQIDRARAASPELLLHLEGLRAQARGRLLRALDRAPYLRLVADLDRFVEGAAAGEAPAASLDPVGPHAARAIVRSFRRLRRAGRDAETRPVAAALHEVRIRAKRLRYALEFFAEAGGPDAAALVLSLTEMQDLLGAHQDAVVGARLARAWGRAGGAAAAVEARVAAERRTAAECRQHFGRAWRRFEERETRRRLERVARRLEPERRAKKKGDAASGVP